MNDIRLSSKIAIGGLLTALAIIFSYVETLIPLNPGIPGIKLGLANIVILFALYNMKSSTALLINVIRVLVVGFMFGNMTSMIFALSGAVFSYFMMLCMHRFTKRHVVVVSVCGALAHIAGQLIAAMFWYPFRVLLYYSLFLMIAAFISGAVNGILVNRINKLYMRNYV